MPGGLHTEALLAAGYATFLLAAATGLELVARYALRRAEQYETAGFTYRDDLDLWECPAGAHLHRHAVDHARRIVRYRAWPDVCNACRLRPDCTDSPHGRELEHRQESWLESEIGRFHRGLSVALLLLAGVILLIAMARHDDPADLVLLGSVLATVGALGARALAALRDRSLGARVTRGGAGLPR